MTPLPPLLEDDDPLGLAKSLADRSLSIARHALTLQPALTVTPDGRLAQVLRHSPIGAQRRFPTLSTPLSSEASGLEISQQLALAKSRANSLTSRIGAFRDMQLPTDNDTTCLGSAIPVGFYAVRGLDVGWTGDGWSVMGAKLDLTTLGIGQGILSMPRILLSPVSGIIFVRYSLKFADRDQDTPEDQLSALQVVTASIDIHASNNVQESATFEMTETRTGDDGDFSQTWTLGDYVSPIAYVVAGTKSTPPSIYRFPLAGAVPTQHQFSTPTQAVVPTP